MTEGEMVGLHQRLNGHEFEQTLIVKDREPWCAAVLGVTKSQMQLSNNNIKKKYNGDINSNILPSTKRPVVIQQLSDHCLTE